jgi:chromosome segregation ATPase
MTEHVDIKQLRQSISSVISELHALGELGDVRKELEEAKAEPDHWQRNLAMLKQEYSEGERALNKVAQAAQDKNTELEKLDAEVKRKTAERDKINQDMQQIRLRLGG